MTAPSTGGFPPATLTPLSPSSVVPQIRVDLHVRPTRLPEVYEVVDPIGGRTVSVRDFETSLMRMLDGKRQASEVVDAAAQIGIPLTIDNLRGFISKMRSSGFLQPDLMPAQPAAPAPVKSRMTWPPRQVWGDPEREMYQQALKLFREDRFADAKRLLGSMLAQRPDSPEAIELFKKVERAIAGGPGTGSFAVAFDEAEATWFAEGEAASDASGEAVARASEPEAVLPRRSKGLWAGLAVMGLGAAAVNVPLPRQTSLPFTLAPAREVVVRTPHAGILGSVSVAVGQDVGKGDAIARYDTEEVKRRAAKVDAYIADLEKQLKVAEGPAHAAKVAKAKAAQQKREQRVTKLTQQRDKLAQKAKGKKTAALGRLDKQLAAARAQVEQGAAEFAALFQDKASQGLHQTLRAEQELKSALASQFKDATIPAPDTGTVSAISVKANQPVAVNDVVGKLEDLSLLKAIVQIEERERDGVHVGDPVTLTLGGQSWSSTVASVDAPVTSDASTKRTVRVVAQVPNPGHKLKTDATGSAELKLPPRSLLSRLMR